MNIDFFNKNKSEKGFLSIGKDFLNRDSFVPVENTDNIKPRGGLWATIHDKNSICYNEWMDYLTEHPHLIFYKYQGCDLSAVYFTLKDDAKILNIESKEKIDSLRILYPDFNGNIDYSLLSTDYDGIFIDVRSLSHDEQNKEYVEQYCINTLLLFNLDCIKEFSPAKVYIELSDDFDYENIEYNIVLNKKKYTLDNNELTRKRR